MVCLSPGMFRALVSCLPALPILHGAGAGGRAGADAARGLAVLALLRTLLFYQPYRMLRRNAVVDEDVAEMPLHVRRTPPTRVQPKMHRSRARQAVLRALLSRRPLRMPCRSVVEGEDEDAVEIPSPARSNLPTRPQPKMHRSLKTGRAVAAAVDAGTGGVPALTPVRLAPSKRARQILPGCTYRTGATLSLVNCNHRGTPPQPSSLRSWQTY